MGTVRPTGRPPARRFVKGLWWLLLAAPLAIAAAALHASPLVIFALSAVAVVPLSNLLGRATEELAGHTGPNVGGLVNATLGNLAELIIGVAALRAGLVELVKASITGSILGNLLLVLGAAQLAGGVRHRTQRFNAPYVGMAVSMLVVAVVGLVVPALFLAAHPDPGRARTLVVSHWVAVLLIAGYALSLVYTMGTHRAVFGEGGDVACGEEAPGWSLRRALLVLVGCAAAIGWMSELLVGSTEATVRALGFSEAFVGLMIVPIIGNAAEHSTAVLMALKNRMDLAAGIAIGSSTQVALLIAPLLVLAGLVLGRPLDLAFSTLEVASVILAVAVTTTVVRDAESNWLEGAFLLIVYAVLGVAFFFF